MLETWPKLNDRQQAVCFIRAQGIHAARIARMLNVSKTTIMRDIRKIAKLIDTQAFRGHRHGADVTKV